MTDYLKLVQQDAQANPYDTLVQADAAQAARQAVSSVAALQPDTEAKLRTLAARAGVPVETVRAQQPEIQRRVAVGEIDYDRLVRDNPVTAGTLTEHAAVARDDVSTLQKLEDTWMAFRTGIQRGSLQDDLGPLHYAAMTGALTPADAQRRTELKSQMQAAQAAGEQATTSPVAWFLGATGYTGRQLVTSLREGGKGALGGAAVGATAAAVIGQLGPQVGLPEEIVTIPGAAMFGARAGFVSAATVHNYKMEAGFAFDEFEAMRDTDGRPMPRDVAQGAAAAVGLLNAGLETLGDVALAKMIPGFDKLLAAGPKAAIKALLARPTARAALAAAGKKWLQSATIEGVTEGVQELVTILGREVAAGTADGTFETPGLAEDAARVGQAAAEAFAGGAGVGAPGATVQAYGGVREVQRAQATQDFMQALGDGAAESKLRERMPEAFRSFVAKAKEQGSIENVYIPAEAFTKYFQSLGVNPAAVAEEVGAKNYSEAAAAGTDVVIPLEDYATWLAPTEHHAKLMPDVKLHMGDLTMREAEAFQAEREQAQKKLAEQAKAEQQKPSSSIEQVRQEVLAELAPFYEASTAEANAAVYVAGIKKLAEAADMDPLELHQAYGLRVVGEQPGSFAAAEVQTLQQGEFDLDGDLFDQLANNASGESAASQEAINRQRQERAAGQARVKVLRDGAVMPLVTAEAVDARAQSGEVILQRGVGAAEWTVLEGDAGTAGNARAVDAARRWWASEGTRLFQGENAKAGSKRGFITFGSDRKFTIGLLEKADLSTFLHETGHFWLEVMGDLAARPGSSEQIKADYQTLLAWFGVESREQITVDHHEQFARANEAYLMEGKAPSAELRNVFQRFRAWLGLIYRHLGNLNVKLNDDVRAVFDRIYATENEIEAAKRQLDVQPLFATAADAGMTDAEFDAYRKNLERSTAAAKDKLQAELMREYQRTREAWWKEKRAEVRQAVAAEIDALPQYQAFAALAAGQLPDGTPVKLNKDDLVRRYGAEYLKRLPRGKGWVYSRTGGTDADTAAEMLGFKTGDELVKALANLRPRDEVIDAETDKRMAAEYGDKLIDGTAADDAMEALHNEQRANVIAAELRALARLQAQVKPVQRAAEQAERQQRSTALSIPPAEVFRDAARGMIGQMQVRDLNPHQYLLAERRASKAAFEAAAKKDYMTAAVEKQRELMNHHLYLEASKAKAEMDKAYEYIGKFDKPTTRQRIGKAGAEYLEQIDAILERYEFRKVSLRQLDRRKSLAEFAQQMEAQGLLVNVPDELLDDARRVNYREATVDELRAVRDVVKNIEHLAGLKGKLLRKREAVEFDQVKGDLIGSLLANFKSTGELGRPNLVGETAREKGARLWKRFDAAHLKVEQLVQWMDGGASNGPWARFVFDLADDAQTREYDLHREVTAKLQALSDAMGAEWRNSMTDKTDLVLPGLQGPVTRYTLLSIALNAGNESNRDRLRLGFAWSDEVVASVLDRLTAQDWQFVQGVWDTVEHLWPEIVALEKRVTGVAPPKIEAKPIQTRFGEFRGGYFPLVYDPKNSSVGEKQADQAESVAQFLANGYGRAQTSKGHTKERVDELKGQPLMLDFEQVLSSHLAKVIKDISHREAAYSINKILHDNDVKRALIDTVGEAQYRELNKWSQVLIADRADTLHQATGMAGLVMTFRTNMAIVTMGWKISTMMAQFAGFGPSADLVKPRYLAQALVDFNRYGPWSTHRETLLAFVHERSGEMRNRTDTLERDVKDALRRLQGDPSPMAAVRRSAFYLTAMADRQVTVPTWLGAYRQGLAEGLNEEDAIRAGDRAVRLSQGAGGAKDLAAVQRNNELMRLLTMYYSPFSVLYARLRDVGHTTRRVQDLPRAAARLLALVVLPAVLGELLAGRGPDDDEDEVWWAIRKTLLYPVASVPVVRDLSSYLEGTVISATGEGEMRFKPSFQLSPVVAAMDKVARTAFVKIPDAVTGDRPWDEVAWDSFEAAGYVFGLPTAQLRISGEYVTDVLTDEANPESPQEALHDLLFRRPRQ